MHDTYPRRKPGRKKRPMPDNFNLYYEAVVIADANKSDICDELHCSQAQLMVWLLEYHCNLLNEEIDQLREANRYLVKRLEELEDD